MPPHIIILQGDNAQGKTNLLEAIYLLSTTRSVRATNERELVCWSSKEEPRVTRLFAEVKRARGEAKLEVALQVEGENLARKRIRINNIVRRAFDLVGQINVVFFSPQDIELIAGTPALRRRYLDLIGAQLDSRYLRSLQRYHQVLVQRNHLLRSIQEQQSQSDQLEFWDKELVEAGSYLIVQRQQRATEIHLIAQAVHQELTSGQEKLGMVYLPSVGQPAKQQEVVAQEFRQALEKNRQREIALGMTLAGPHRDDLYFLVDGVDMAIYGSRGQQRTIALSLRLAEVKYMQAKTGDSPILLLDEVLSELDRTRRSYLQQFILPYEQVLITTTDLDRFEPAFLAQAAQFRVRQGKIESLQQ